MQADADAAGEQAACNLSGNVTDCCERQLRFSLLCCDNAV
jgi:hypothetical protein